MIKFENVDYYYSKRTSFEKHALKDINLYIDENSTTGIIGESGSGKSTLVQHLNGLLVPYSGTVSIDGEIISKKTNLKELRSKVGFVFQNPEDQFFCENVRDEIAFGLKNLGTKNFEIDDKILEVISKVNLDEKFLTKSPFELSGGEKHKVAIASVLVMNPKILVMDEPTAGLDSLSRRKLIKNIKEFKDITIIVISHDIEDIIELCHDVIILKDGRIVYHGGVSILVHDQLLVEKHNINLPLELEIDLKIYSNKL